MKKRVLITGITGMAGSHLADLLLNEEPECEVYGIKRWRSSMSNIAHIEDKLQLVDCNLTDQTACTKLIENSRPDYIFHLAAHSFVLDSWSNPHTTINDNIMMQLNLFEAIRSVGIDPVVQVALSSEEYGYVPAEESPITEKTPFRPLSPYAVSKVGQDMLAYQYFKSYKLRVIRTRAFNHEGPRRGEVFVTSSFAKQIAEIEAGLKPPVIYVGNLEARRDWSDVRDVVRAYWLSVQHCTPGEDYVIASGRSRTIGELLDYLLSKTKTKIKVEVDPARLRPSDVVLLEGDASKFRKATNWQARYTFEQTMNDLLNYWREEIRIKQAGAASPG